MATTHHQAGRRGGAILVAALLAGTAAAIGVLLQAGSRDVAQPFFGLSVDEAVAAPHPPAVPPPPPLAAIVPDSGHGAVPSLLPAGAPAAVEPAIPTPAVVASESPWGAAAVTGFGGAEAAVRPVNAEQPTLAAPLELPAPPPLVPLSAVPAAPPGLRLEPQQTPDEIEASNESDRPASEAFVTDASNAPPAPAAPLPGEAWSDPDGVNWVDAPGAAGAAARSPAASRVLERIVERRNDARGSLPAPDGPRRQPVTALGERLRDRLRGEGRLARAINAPQEAGGQQQLAIGAGWPTPDRLLDQLEELAATRGSEAGSDVSVWAAATLEAVHAALETDGPADSRAADSLLVLGEGVTAGMAAADGVESPEVASQARRAALAVARRVAVWRAAAAWCGEQEAGAASQPGDVAVLLGMRPAADETRRLLGYLERYETSTGAADAATVRAALESLAGSSSPAAVDLARAVAEHYHAANVRVAVHREFVERMLPESTVTSGPVQDFVLGRPVRGRSTVEQSMAVRFVPHAGEIRLELLVNGEVASRTVTESGPVAIHSRGLATFTVFKPISVTPAGLAFGVARGTASSQAQLASIETSFDSVPIMGSLVRSLARSQHDEARQQANREVSGKIVGRACRQVDQEAEPKLSEMAERIRERLWRPLVTLGLEPRAVALETTDDVASMRLRLAAANQLAAHTPRPRAPADALVSCQVHETVANNAVGQFGFAGRRLELPQLAGLVCERLGIAAAVPDDLPDGVAVTFAAVEPVRLECRDGLVHVRVSLDTFESGRRTWHDIVAKVAYRPVARGPQVFLEREGPVQIGGPGHEGRMEIGLRTIFGKIFAKERPLPLVPAKVTENPRLAGLRAVQAVATDGWLGIALATPRADVTGEPAAPSPTAAGSPPADRRLLRR